MSPATFAQRLRRARQQAQLTQHDLARRAGITRSAISQWEIGQVSRVDAAPLLKVARALGTTIDWLLEGESRETREDPADYVAVPPEIGTYWHDLTQRQQARILEQIQQLAEDNRDARATRPAD